MDGYRSGAALLALGQFFEIDAADALRLPGFPPLDGRLVDPEDVARLHLGQAEAQSRAPELLPTDER